MSAKKWLSTGYSKSAPAGKVDDARGIIEGVSVCTAGEAKGHGVSLDNEFIGRVVEFGNSKKQGLKARFGHPNMCSTALGTFIGRFKNFRADANGSQARADLFLSNEAKETPNGDLFSYVMGLAKNEPDMFGTSIVFTPGRIYKKDEKTQEKIYAPGQDDGETYEHYQERKKPYDQLPGPEYVECDELHACDAVDDPAANDGLFSRFSQETVAGQLTEFLDLHPQIWQAVSDNPDIIRALAAYGDKVDEFLSKYRDYLKKNPDGKRNMSEEKEITPAADAPKEEAAKEQAPVSAQPKADEAKETESNHAKAPKAAAPKADEPKQEEAKKDPEPVKASAGDPACDVHSEFSRMISDFGEHIAAETFRNKGTYADAEKAFYAAMRDENKQLKAQVEELQKQFADKGGKPAEFAQTPEKPVLTLVELCARGTKK